MPGRIAPTAISRLPAARLAPARPRQNRQALISAPPIRKKAAYRLMNGVIRRTQYQPRMAPEGRLGWRLLTTTGENATRRHTIRTNGKLMAVARLANLRGHDRYNDPWASGYPPSAAPAMYQALLSRMVLPATVMAASISVPRP